MKYPFLILLLSFSFNICFSQAADFIPEAKKYFLIVSSTKNYSSALKKANDISEKLSLKLDLRDLINVDEGPGLAWTKSTCEKYAFDFPCYAIPRGRYDDGDYVSIEWSSEYQGFSEGYYIVVIASHINYDKTIKNLLKKAKKIFPSAYIKSSMIYIGCMH